MTDTEHDFQPDKIREYRLYLIWLSLPRDMDASIFRKLGVKDETIIALAGCKTQKALAKYLDIQPNTITEWNKHEVPKEYEELDWRVWAKKTTPAVASAVLRRIRKLGDPAAATWWMKHVEGYEEKSQHALTDANGESIAKGLADLIAGADKVLEANGESI